MEKTIKRGDIYYATLNPVVGSEQGGTRPVLIISNNTGNRYSPTVIIAPITSRVHTKAKLPTHIAVTGEFIGTLDWRYILEVDVALAVSIGLDIQKKD